MRLLTVPAVLTVLAGLSAQAHGGVLTQPVVGGTMVPPGKWPDAVAVLGPTGSCTGTLIAPDVVLTAGHCAGIAPTEVVVDTTNYNGAGGKRIAVQSITAYPDYQHSFDVAVIVLVKPVDNVAPRAIGRNCTFAGFVEETQVHLVGFGLTQLDGGGSNTSLREAVAPVLDADCSGGNGCRVGASPAGEFVAGGGGSDSCFGDSGGPVYLDTERGPIAIAAVSRGLDDAATPCGGGGIYVRTDKLIKWIEETAGRAVAKDDCSGAGDLYSSRPDDDGEGGLDRSESTSVGCSAGGATGGGAALIAIFLPLANLRRRRRRA